MTSNRQREARPIPVESSLGKLEEYLVAVVI